MNEAASELKYGSRVDIDRVEKRVLVREDALNLPPSPIRGAKQSTLAVRVLTTLMSYFHRDHADEIFRWNVSAKQIGVVHPETVYCVELPVSDPVGMLRSYMQAGVRADRVVFVGDPLTIKDEAYYAITRKGALVHDTPKKGRRGQAQRELTPYFATEVPAGPPPTSNPHPYTYKPGPPKVTPEQLQALVDAIGRRR